MGSKTSIIIGIAASVVSGVVITLLWPTLTQFQEGPELVVIDSEVIGFDPKNPRNEIPVKFTVYNQGERTGQRCEARNIGPHGFKDKDDFRYMGYTPSDEKSIPPNTQTTLEVLVEPIIDRSDRYVAAYYIECWNTEPDHLQWIYLCGADSGNLCPKELEELR